MVDSSVDASVPVGPKSRRRSIFGRMGDWLFSQRHFHLKLLSGTTVGAVVIIFLAGVFLLVTLRNHYQESFRTHTIEVIRLSSLIENDIAGLESMHRGYLLSGTEDYIAPFEKKRDLIKQRTEDLTALILDDPRQRKRIIKVQEVVQQWIDTVATPEMNARRTRDTAPSSAGTNTSLSFALGNSLLDQAREVLQSLQDEEQILLNQRMQDSEWAMQSSQILDFLPKVDRAVVEMEKEKRGYLLTGENNFLEAYKRAVGDFYTYHGYLSVLVANSPSQAQVLSDIRSDVERWISKTAVPQIDFKRAGKDAEALALVGAGETVMAGIRDKLTNFEKSQLNLYELRARAATRQRIFRTSALALVALFAVGLLVVSNSYSFVLVRR